MSARCGYADAIATAFPNAPEIISRTISVTPLQIRFPHHGVGSSSEDAFPCQRDYRTPRRAFIVGRRIPAPARLSHATAG